MIINDILIDIKKEIQSCEDETKLDKLTFLGRCLVELKAYQEMYKDDLVRVNKYYEEAEKSFKIVEELLGGE